MSIVVGMSVPAAADYSPLSDDASGHSQHAMLDDAAGVADGTVYMANLYRCCWPGGRRACPQYAPAATIPP